MKPIKKIVLILLLTIPLPLVALNSCSCFTSIWTSHGWLDIEYWYATNNGSCLPSGSNVYNFGYSMLYLDGQYIGMVYYGGNSNINDYLSCYNWT